MGNTEQNTMRIKNTIQAVNRAIKKYNTIQIRYKHNTQYEQLTASKKFNTIHI